MTKPLTELTRCTYIGPTALTLSCGHPAIEGRSYCEHHYPLVYKVGSANRKRYADIRRAAAVWDLESEFNSIVLELENEESLV